MQANPLRTHENPNRQNQKVNRRPLVHRITLRLITQRWPWPKETYDQRDLPKKRAGNPHIPD
jgi:hypothetical protein